ncbi:agouti signaling protein 1 [Engraulis encrasicolus]|uniref:agouti signaling protein 1 n=1 Tax=Engraulis encrasicolus TaxID=184585 RepID=UPI002FD40677
MGSRLHAFWLLLLLSCASCLLVCAHILLEERGRHPNGSPADALQEHAHTHSHSPPVLIVELPKSSKKNKTKTEKRPKKNKYSVKKKRPTPPANCVPLWGSCKTPNAVCCDYCAHCHCRIFKTVCYCRMGYPGC